MVRMATNGAYPVRLLPLLAIVFAGSLRATDTLIEIDAARPAAYKIPRTIYGTFLEPIGHSIYPGLWAQILENPSFEDNLWSMRNLERMVKETPALTHASSLGLPLPWQPLEGGQGARYEPRWNDAANSFRSLEIMALPGKETGVRQTIYLPVHRVRRYNGSIYIKHLEGPAQVEVSLRRREPEAGILASATITAPEPHWSRYEFSLEVPSGRLAPLEAADFVISLRNEARATIDQVFLFPIDAVDGMDPEMVALSRELGSPVVRFGGNFTSGYHWRDGVGPIDKRVTMLNQAWGMPEYNHFGTDEFLRFCERIGAEPQIALNLGSGTPEEAASWVRYVNQRWGDRRGGLLWELGNELWGTFQIGYPTLERVAERTRAFSQAIRTADSRARLIATGGDPDRFRDWNAAQLALPSGTFEFLSTHFVVGNGDVQRPQPAPEFIRQAAFALPVGLERRLREMKEQIDAGEPARGRVALAFTEWLFHGPNDDVPRFTNMGGAICAAGFLNTLIRVADFTPLSNMTGLIEFGGIWKKRGRVFGVPAYWAFRMYSTADATRPVQVRVAGESYDVEMGNKRIPEIRAVPYLDVVAALNDARDRLTLFCVNRNATTATQATVKIGGFVARADAEVETLAGPGPNAVNSEEHPDMIRPQRKTRQPGGGNFRYTFPPASVTVMHLRAGKL